jgi:hypothetical protein
VEKICAHLPPSPASPLAAVLAGISSLHRRDVCFLGVNRDSDEKQACAWERGQRGRLRIAVWGRSAAQRHVRACRWWGPHWSRREAGGCWCAGAHVAGRARAVFPADSAEQAGTNSPVFSQGLAHTVLTGKGGGRQPLPSPQV